MSRYQKLFARLDERGQGAFVPFVTLGDPDPETSLAILRALIAGGADALELGLPFSDPVADGPTIQKASLRALAAGVRTADCLKLVRTIRDENPELPIGLLVYANLVSCPDVDTFYKRCADAGVDSVLIADVPLRESLSYSETAQRHGIEPIYIAPPDASNDRLQQVAEHSKGYVYLLSRAGVTGAEQQMVAPASAIINTLREAGSAPPLLGFGIATPDHVQAALAAGAAGAISGSAVVRIIEQHLGDVDTMTAELESFVRVMKKATNKP